MMEVLKRESEELFKMPSLCQKALKVNDVTLNVLSHCHDSTAHGL